MSPAPAPPSLDPQLTLIVTSFITAIVGYAAARVGVKTKRIEKAPEVQEQINRAVSDLITHYTKALEQEKARHADHIAEMDEKLNRALARIEHLEDTMRRAGMVVPTHPEN
jgi:predicted  nucleic acid-binding Zn-ribbon protein